MIEINVRFVCANGTIDDTVHVNGDKKGRTRPQFVQEKGTVQHVVAEYGGQQYEIPRGKNRLLEAEGLPPVRLAVLEHPRKAGVKYERHDLMLEQNKRREEHRRETRKCMPTYGAAK